MSETKQNSGITRKDFLRYILITAGVSAVGGGAFIYQEREILDQPLTVESLRYQFSDVQGSFQMIGKKYLEKYPQGIPESGLLREVNDKLSSGNINRYFLSNLSDLVRQQILLDFEESNLVNLEGWIITETEAQICAIIAT
jgi:hypothetical protein